MKPEKVMYPDCHINFNTLTFLGPDALLRPCCFVNNARHWRQFTDWCDQNSLDWRTDLDITRGVKHVAESKTWNQLHLQLDKLHNMSLNDTEQVQHLAPQPCWEMCAGRHRRQHHKKR